MDPITEAMATTSQTQTELKSLKSQLQDYMKDKETLNSQLNGARNSLASRTQEKDNLTSQLNDARASQLSWGNRSAAYREGRIEIHFIVYGGALIWDDNVARRLIGYARNNQEWTMTDEEMGRDPWYGTMKAGAVVYRYDNRGEMRCLSARQGDKARFDPL
ncbi:hypothetical protein MMC15_002630 [Xylographa vitiligo]|nr:hypothetical protein [Xylographa vitiligo]